MDTFVELCCVRTHRFLFGLPLLMLPGWMGSDFHLLECKRGRTCQQTDHPNDQNDENDQKIDKRCSSDFVSCQKCQSYA